MSTLYLIGGAPRAGKTTVAMDILRKGLMPVYFSDVIREGVRGIFSDETYISIKKLNFSGSAVFHRPGESAEFEHSISFSKEQTEDEMTWNALRGIINKFDRKNIPILIEGIHVTLENIKTLQLKHLTIKTAFVGFLDDSYLEMLLTQAYKNKDWVYKAIQENGGDDTKIRDWFKTEVEKNKKLQKEVEQEGYAFFSVNVDSFEGYCKSVVDYLLK